MFIVNEVTKTTLWATMYEKTLTNVNFSMSTIFLFFPLAVPLSDYLQLFYQTHRPYRKKKFEIFVIQVFKFVSPYIWLYKCLFSFWPMLFADIIAGVM